MTPPRILTAIHLGLHGLNKRHGALDILWRRFSTSIRTERRRRKIKLKDFARNLGVTSTMVGFLERNKRPWSMDRAELAVKLLTRQEQWPD